MALNPLTVRVQAFKLRGFTRRASPIFHPKGLFGGFDPCELLSGENARAICRAGKGFLEDTGGDECGPGFVRNPITGSCELQHDFLPDIDPEFLSPGEASERVGQAVMGRYGAGIAPGNKVINRAVCLRGMQLGNDGVCYNKSQISNKQRMWPAGRRPLLTGGQMRAISIAAAAGRRLERTTKRLQKIGLMKKPAPRRKQITSGSTEHHHHT